MQSQDMRCSRYTDGQDYEELKVPLPGSLLPPPPCAVYMPASQQEFDSITQRIPTSFLLYVTPNLTVQHQRELEQVHRDCGVPVVVANLRLVPSLTPAFGRCAPFFAKMYQHRVLRFLDREPTHSNLCSFATSDRQWRSVSLRA
jgi:hypothetical protein